MDIASYVEGWKRRIEERALARSRREAALRARLPVVVRLLIERYGAGRVVLFGSLARGRAHARSDVDLAVAGLTSERFLAAWRDIEDALGPAAAFDLVRIEEARGWLREQIDAGEVLFDAG